MNRHSKNKKFAIKHRQNKRFLWVVVVVGMTLLLGTIFFVYSPRSASNHTGFFSTYYNQMKAWMADRRGHLNKKAPKPKHILAKQSESEPQIHFEFYTALPNMQANGGSPTLKKVK